MSARVGAFGDSVALTPNLDALAASGVRYPNTFTTAGVCAPSRAAHILGRYQIATGTQHMRSSSRPEGGYRSVPPAGAKAYPELLRAAGYYTYTDTKLDYQFSGTMWNSGPFTIWSDEGSGTHWRNRNAGQPFFGFINFGVTHESGVFAPLGTWPHSLTHFVMQVLRAVRSPDVDVPEQVRPEVVPLPPYYPDTPTARKDIARHYNNIAVMDAQVGALLDQLEADGLAGSTIVIWTTDHGDGLPRGKRELYDSGIRVPMIIRWPARYLPAGVQPGSEEQRLISFVDLAPTILRLAGVPLPPGLHGQDIVTDQPRRYVYAARDRIDEVLDRQRAVRDGRYKYIRSWYPEQPGGHALEFRDNIDMMRELHTLYANGELNPQQRLWFEAPGQERLFDIVNDPFELRDLSGDEHHATTLARMRDAMEQWRTDVGDWSDINEAQMVERFMPDGEVQTTRPPVASVTGGSVHLEATTEGASIGYRVEAGPWQVYREPIGVQPGSTLEAKAVRYGWDESDAIEIRIP